MLTTPLTNWWFTTHNEGRWGLLTSGSSTCQTALDDSHQDNQHADAVTMIADVVAMIKERVLIQIVA